jgi:hypothetical protein
MVLNLRSMNDVDQTKDYCVTSFMQQFETIEIIKGEVFKR